MNVYVDLAPAVESGRKLNKPPPLEVKPCKALIIPKISRHNEAHHRPYFDVSYSSTEQAVIAALPLNAKHGLILAKAFRIAIRQHCSTFRRLVVTLRSAGRHLHVYR